MILISPPKIKEFFIDLTQKSGGHAGTYLDPFGTIAEVQANLQNHARYRFKRGEIHYTEINDWDGLSLDGVQRDIYFGDYGDSDQKAWYDGSRLTNSGWTNVTGAVYSNAGRGNETGALIEDIGGDLDESRQILTWIEWLPTESDAQVAAKMYPGTYSHRGTNNNSNEVLVWTFGSENPNTSNNIYIQSVGLGIRTTNRGGSILNNMHMEDLGIQGFSRQGANFEDTHDILQQNLYVRFCGGDWQTGQYFLGGGLQWSAGCNNVVCQNNYVRDVWDAPVSPQLYRNRDNEVMENIYVRNNRLEYFAYGGIEISSWNANPAGGRWNNWQINNVHFEDNFVYGSGYGFSGTTGQSNRLGIRGADDCNGVKFTAWADQSTGHRITGNTFKHCRGSALYWDGLRGADGLVFENNIVEDMGLYGVNLREDDGYPLAAVVKNNIFRDCGTAAVRHNAPNSTSMSVYRNNTIDNCGDGIDLVATNGANPVPLVRDNIAVNGRRGIYSRGGAGDITEYNNLCFNNSTANFGNFTKDATSLEVDPEFSDARMYDYALSYNSPAIDAGSGNTNPTDCYGNEHWSDDLGAVRSNYRYPQTNHIDGVRFESWTNSGCAAATIGGVKGYDGLYHPRILSEDSTTGTHQIYTDSATVASGEVIRWELDIKRAVGGTRTWCRLELTTKDAAPGYYGAYFDLENVAVGATNGIGDAAGIITLGDGWYRIWIELDAGTGVNNPRFKIRSTVDDSTWQMAGTGKAEFYIDRSFARTSVSRGSLMGNWVVMNRNGALTEQATISANAGVKVVEWVREWSELEASTSNEYELVFNNTEVRELMQALGQAERDGVPLLLRMRWRSWDNGVTPCPQWIVDKGLRLIHDANGVDYGTYMADPVAAGAYKRFVKGIIDIIRAHRGLAGLNIQEGALGDDTGAGTSPTNYFRQDWIDTRLDIIDYLAQEQPYGFVQSLENSYSGWVGGLDLSAAINQFLDRVATLNGGTHYPLYMYGSPDTLPGARSLIDADRNKGMLRRASVDYPTMLKMDSMQHHDHAWEGDGVGAEGGSKVEGWLPPNGADVWPLLQSANWTQEQNGIDVLQWNYRVAPNAAYGILWGDTDGTSDTILLQPDPWIPARNHLSNSEDLSAGSWTPTRIESVSTYGVGGYPNDVEDDRTSQIVVESSDNGQHGFTQVVPHGDFENNATYTAIVMFTPGDIISGGLDRRLRLEIDNTEGTRYSAHFHPDTGSWVSVDGSPTGDLIELDANSFGVWFYAYINVPMGNGSTDVNFSIKLRNGTTNTYAGDDTAEALVFKRATLIRRVRP